MKYAFIALLACCFYSCDYSTLSNGNIDAAYARETIRTEAPETHHGAAPASEHGPTQGDHSDTSAEPTLGNTPDHVDNNEEPHEPVNDATIQSDSLTKDLGNPQHQ